MKLFLAMFQQLPAVFVLQMRLAKAALESILIFLFETTVQLGKVFF